MENQKEIIISTTKESFIEPFNIEVQPGDTIIMNTPDRTESAVVIPNFNSFAEPQEKENYKEHRFPEDGELRFQITEKPKYRLNHYHVYLRKLNEFADKPNHSAPKIIIKE